MLIEQMNEEIHSALYDIWERNAGRLPDNMRNNDLMDHWLFFDGGATRLYLVGEKPTLVIVGDIQVGLSATILLLNHEFAEVGEILHELRKIIDELSLKRLTAQVPGPVKDTQRVLERIGFRREGHLRRSTYWNGRLCGTDVWGLYRDPTYEPRRKANAQTRDRAPRADSGSESATPQPANAAA